MTQSRGIPTPHEGSRFRSRLEARWAAFFDLLNWKWVYEPFDCAGWIPDFLLRGKSPTLVEVKPVVEFPEDVAKKIQDQALDYEMLIVGCDLGLEETGLGDDGVSLGWHRQLGSRSTKDDPWEEGLDLSLTRWYPAPLLTIPQRHRHGDHALPPHVDWCSDVGDYTGRITGFYDGNIQGDETTVKSLIHLWREAGNRVQWKAKPGS